MNSLVYVCELENIDYDESCFTYLYNLMPLIKKNHVLRITNKKQKLQHLFVYGLLEHVCNKNNINYSSKNIKYTKYGKPYFFSSNYFFNLSHCEDGIICGLSSEKIGVDVEKIVEDIEDIVYFTMSKQEKIEIENCKKPNILFTRYWVLKESYLKYIGVGLTDYINKLDFSAFNNIDEFSAYGCKFKVIKKNNIYIACCSKRDIKFIQVEVDDFVNMGSEK
ncbi:4'-phosphopantetheinyl transferase superfamily protein [Streptococcus anginosus]|nr:4'-phosphopantetheinyl transferase superfamily protein [Streptococcus anginosus]MED5798017.1 4'-phosphopantetheinyl transferase superfamily protein [Streptococcus anginosus]